MKRNCPKCNKEILYKRKNGYNLANKHNSSCNDCRMKCLHLSNKVAREKQDYKRNSHIGKCIECGKEFIGPECKKCCSDACSRDHNYYVDDPIVKKARTLGGCITFGKGKTEFLTKLITNSLNKECKYCNNILTINNISLDHIIPFNTISNRKDKQISRELNVRDNLQIICKKCNQRKGNLPENEFIILLDFLKQHPILNDFVLNKLSQSNLFWRSKYRK